MEATYAVVCLIFERLMFRYGINPLLAIFTMCWNSSFDEISISIKILNSDQRKQKKNNNRQNNFQHKTLPEKFKTMIQGSNFIFTEFNFTISLSLGHFNTIKILLDIRDHLFTEISCQIS